LSAADIVGMAEKSIEIFVTSRKLATANDSRRMYFLRFDIDEISVSFFTILGAREPWAVDGSDSMRRIGQTIERGLLS
jgi:hypothetical protein